MILVTLGGTDRTCQGAARPLTPSQAKKETDTMSLKPYAKVPHLRLATVGGRSFDLAQEPPAAFTLIVFYRGLHCPICKAYLRDLDRMLTEFAALGVGAIAASTDSAERAAQSKADWGLGPLELAYGLEIPAARSWGLYISAGIKAGEPALFAEPGLFVVKPDQTLYAASVQTMPFARPPMSDVLGAIKFVKEKGYPARGEA